MAVTAKLVKELREMTGAGMMDCKKALTATDGDMDKAVEFLREKGLATAQKKAGRIAAEGIVMLKVSEDGKKAVAVEVNAETDFVAKNAKFQAYVADVAAQALASSAADMDSFMAENAAAMGSFALGAVRITGWCFAAVTAVFVWMITAGASRLKASKTLLRLAEAAEGFDCKKGLPLEAVDEKKARALKRVRRFIRNGWLSAWVDEKAENCIVVASGANANLLPSDLAKAEEAIELADLILMQLEVPMETVCFVADIAWQKGKKVILNPAPAHPLPADLLHHLYLITPNETEAEMITGVKITDDISAVEAARVLSGMGVQHVIITLGSKGALICSDGEAEIVPALKVEAVDTTAAGDVFNGALTVALSEGRNLKESVRFACKASAISVTRVGAQSSAPYRNEVDIFD